MTTALLYFKSPTCVPCRQMKPAVDEVRDYFGEHVNVAEVDIFERPDLATKHGVKTVPSFVVIVDGQVADMRVGSMRAVELIAAVAPHVP